MAKDTDSDTNSILEAWRSRGTTSSDSERSMAASSCSSSDEITPQAGATDDIKILSEKVLDGINTEAGFLFAKHRNFHGVFSDQGTEVPMAETESEEESNEESEEVDAEAGEESESDELEAEEVDDDSFGEKMKQSEESTQEDTPSSSQYVLSEDDIIEQASSSLLHSALQHLRDLEDPDVHSPHPRRHLRPPITAAEQAPSLPLYEQTAHAHVSSFHTPPFLYGVRDQATIYPQATMYPQAQQTYSSRYYPTFPPQHSFPNWAYPQPYQNPLRPAFNETGDQPADMVLPHSTAQQSPPVTNNSIRSTGHDKIAATLSKSHSQVLPLYRRFLKLNHRVLLHLQTDISDLEQTLHRVDRDLHICSEPDFNEGVDQAHRRANNMEGLRTTRTELLGRIFVKLQQYHKALALHTSGEKAYQSASAYDISKYLTWLSNHSQSNEVYDHIFNHTDDLIALPNRRISSWGSLDQAGSTLHSFFTLLGSYTFIGVYIYFVSFMNSESCWITALALFVALLGDRIAKSSRSLWRQE